MRSALVSECDSKPRLSVGGARILQVHPTLTCNLRCRHCYSDSGAWVRGGLPITLLERAVADAIDLGYEVLSVSGGEPFLYRDLPRLLKIAKARGMRTTVTSNGTLLPARLRRVADCLDGVALSLDGPRAFHNELRASRDAFDRLERGIDAVSAAGVPFGLIMTVTEGNWRSIPWAADFAVARGARLLQLHPLELIGRASAGMMDQVLSPERLERAYLLSRAAQAHYRTALNVQLDLLLREDILAAPELVYAEARKDTDLPADELRSLVIEADGLAVPIAYGFSRHLALGDLSLVSLTHAWERWGVERSAQFRALCRSVYRDVAASSDRLVDWHHLLVTKSAAAGATSELGVD